MSVRQFDVMEIVQVVPAPEGTRVVYAWWEDEETDPVIEMHPCFFLALVRRRFFQSSLRPGQSSRRDTREIEMVTKATQGCGEALVPMVAGPSYWDVDSELVPSESDNKALLLPGQDEKLAIARAIEALGPRDGG